MKKMVKAQSGIITTVLLILITIAGLVILANIILPLVREGKSEINADIFAVSIEIVEVKLYGTGDVAIKIKNNKGEITKLKFIFYDEYGNTHIIEKSQNIFQLETKTFNIFANEINIVEKIQKVSIAPIIGDKQGLEVQELDSQIKKNSQGKRVIDFPESCANILSNGDSKGNGMYLVDPDGIVGNNAITVYCDMMTSNGGWTLVWEPNSFNENYLVGGTDYLLGTKPIVSKATESLVAFANADKSSMNQVWKITMPNYWKTNHPFSIQCGSETITATRISDCIQLTDELVFGTGSFSFKCSDACSNTWGRVCLRRQGFNGAYDFPFYNAFSHTNPDYCSQSSDARYDTVSCNTLQKKFVIFVR